MNVRVDPAALFRVDGQVALVTGGSKGIGFASAELLAAAGADVVITGRDSDALLDAANAINANGGGEVHPIVCDAADIDALSELPALTIERAGRLDILVNNVGGSPPRPLLDTSERMFEYAFRFNVTTAFALSKAALPELLNRRGSIVNISSAIGRLTDRGMVAYGTAKGALTHMTRLMATECAPKVRVNAIAVGATRTAALSTVLDDPLETAMAQATPLGRIGEPIDIAAGVLYLASPAGSYVTGKIIEIDGGIEAPNLPLNLPDL